MIETIRETKKYTDEFVIYVSGTYANSERTFTREIGNLSSSSAEDLYNTYRMADACKDRNFHTFCTTMMETCNVHEFLETDYRDRTKLFDKLISLEVKYFDEQSVSFDVEVRDD